MSNYTLHITEDEALVLFDFFQRFDDSNKLEFIHSAEYIALMRLAAQVDKTTPAMFDPNFVSLLEQARCRVAEGFDGDVPGMKSET